MSVLARFGRVEAHGLRALIGHYRMTRRVATSGQLHVGNSSSGIR